jgi:hypothetical protein
MTCRVARSYQHFAQMEPVPCFECGSAYMDVPVASWIRGPRLCPICAQSLSPRVVSLVYAPCVPMRHQKVA